MAAHTAMLLVLAGFASLAVAARDDAEPSCHAADAYGLARASRKAGTTDGDESSDNEEASTLAIRRSWRSTPEALVAKTVARVVEAEREWFRPTWESLMQVEEDFSSNATEGALPTCWAQEDFPGVDGGVYVCTRRTGTRLPLLVFAHGNTVPPALYTLFLSDAANGGFMAVAYRSCLYDAECLNGASSFLEVLKVIAAFAEAPGNEVAGLPPADMSKPVTVTGHSTGARATMMAAAVKESPKYLQGTWYALQLEMNNSRLRNASKHIGVAVAMHVDAMYDSDQNPDVSGYEGAVKTTPMLQITSVGEDMEPPEANPFNWQAVSSPDKVYLDIRMGSHVETIFPNLGGYWVVVFARAFALHNPRAWELIYGNTSLAMKNLAPYATEGQANTLQSHGLVLCSQRSPPWPLNASHLCAVPLSPGDVV